MTAIRRRRATGRRSQNTSGVEYEEESIAQLMNPSNQLTNDWWHSLRRWLEVATRQFENVADLVNKEAYRPVIRSDNDVHRTVRVTEGGQLEPTSQINGSNDLTSQIDEAANYRWSRRHSRQLLMTDHFLHPRDVDGQVKTFNRKGAELSAGGFTAHA